MGTTKKSTMSYVQRLALINQNADTRSVWDSIDRPIRPLVFELARIGMIPKFSCCGFTYLEEGLDEPKTHHGGRAYVHFFIRDSKKALQNFEKLKELVYGCNWNMKQPFTNVIELYTFDCCPTNMYAKEDGVEESIHQYEGYAIKIQTMAYAIQEFIPTACDPIEIIDGNRKYNEINPEWQIKAKQNFTIGVKEYYEKYGKKPVPEYDTTEGTVNSFAVKELLPKEIYTHQWIPESFR